ncbi:DUF1963 domain-containing protein [Microtetraspora sp. AC03309]|uniref:DUF1963 domain-containing protein n=1 Tax=Microtetraspora sp. AC03309 TaxID=2779376 RepID=UPI001E3E0E0A|nr:DUF1963 domain-containing protein [Microtetraspora sp. AC03309]MCC5582050.1 DUF1963 domain-containing protein [Microtetraspora sp. AC03309]
MESEGRVSGSRAAIEEIVRAELGVDTAERFLPLVRPSVGFAVRTDLIESGSLIGGVPRATESFEWPHYRGHPMVLLAQLDCGQAARLLGRDWTLPRDGYLLFFHDDDFAAEFSFDLGDDGCRVVHVAAGSDGQPRDGGGTVIPALPLEASALPSVPTWADAEADQAVDGDVRALINLDKALSALIPTPRHRLLGWCDSSDTPQPEGHRPLLQVEAESGTDWGEIVNVSFWIRDEDLRAGDLSNVRRSCEVA